jgi:hypothetical protein
MRLLSPAIYKSAESIQLKKLKEAKKCSDNKDYNCKNKLLADLLKDYPSEFKVDSITNKKYVGLTHKPTSFKIHAPRTLVPVGIEHNYTN